MAAMRRDGSGRLPRRAGRSGVEATVMARRRKKRTLKPRTPARIRKRKRARGRSGHQHAELVGLAFTAFGLFLASVLYLGWSGGLVGGGIVDGVRGLLGATAYATPVAFVAIGGLMLGRSELVDLRPFRTGLVAHAEPDTPSLFDALPGERPEYRLPERNVLRTGPAGSGPSAKASARIADALVETLAHFGVEATISGQIAGPRVTRYELQLAPGTKVAKVAALKDDLSYALATTEIRILAPIPGKQAVGVELPNLSPNLVTL